MSLRSYLFSLIGLLIVLLTTTQLTLVYWIERNLAQEVETQARQLSKKVIELAFDQLDIGSKPHQYSSTGEEKFIKKVITIKSTGIRSTSKNEKSKDNTFNEEITIDITASEKALMKQEFQSLVEGLHQEHLNNTTNTEPNDDKNYTFVIKTTDNSEKGQKNKIMKHWISEDISMTTLPDNTASTKTANLFRSIKWLLIISAIIALLFAYWLSAQFNKPLKLLITGFENLAQGDYHTKVDENGVKEIRSAIIHFNKMVSRLGELTQIEQQHQEISHLAELGEVSRGLAHALRNPIHTIGLTLEQLSQHNLTPQQRSSLLSTAQNKINHIDKNIRALLTLTTTGISRNEHIPVLAVIQDIVLELKSAILTSDNNKQTFIIDVDASINIIGAESEIRSILHTLIINASEASSADATINIKAVENQGNITVTVIDNGEGLKNNIKAQLFQPHISSKPEGAGMGLYIAKRIISLHYQGELTLRDNIDINAKSNTENDAETNAETKTKLNKGCTALAFFKQSTEE